MIHVEPKDMKVPEIHQYLLGGVAPRPIALVSTITKNGHVNLSPFSFFNAFSANPPIVVFSPSRRGRDGTTKDTYNNLSETRECVVQAVTYEMVQQVSLASTEYPPETDEFRKSGLTPVPSDIVRPPRVKESPFQMECILKQMLPLGDRPAAGNLAICEVVKFHVAEDIVVDGVIEPNRIDLVGRNGADYYTRAQGEAIFSVAKPIGRQGVGFDNLPAHTIASRQLTANNLAQLANSETIPGEAEVRSFIESQDRHDGGRAAFRRFLRLGDYRSMLQTALAEISDDSSTAAVMLEAAAARALDSGDTDFAWNVLMYIPLLEKR